jgi:ABC-type transporter Mla maintaining outer membrane lipid asymmetry ATPase subunit MlaF
LSERDATDITLAFLISCWIADNYHIISEDLDEILALSDRVAVIYEGRIMNILFRQDATRERLGLLMAGVHSEEGASVVK